MKKLIRPSHKYIAGDENYPKYIKKLAIICGIAIALIIIFGTIANIGHPNSEQNQSDTESYIEDTTSQETKNTEQTSVKLYTVTHIVDGDTLDIDYDGETTRIRLIGVDTPETVDSRTTIQCFGREASDYLKSKLEGKQVSIESDPTQSNRDKYDRLLRYVYLEGAEDIGLSIIANGYGHEYTYDIPYQKQSEYQTAEQTAESQNLGLWSPNTCNGNTKQSATSQTSTSAASSASTSSSAPTTSVVSGVAAASSAECNIKGNINSKGEKIYHVPGQQYYDKTIINTSKGEQMFCTEAEAIAAGWRKAKV